MKDRKLLLSIILNLFLIIVTVTLFIQKENTSNLLSSRKLKEETYVQNQWDESHWETNNPNSYYLFIDDNNISIETFNKKVLLASDYELATLYCTKIIRSHFL